MAGTPGLLTPDLTPSSLAPVVEDETVRARAAPSPLDLSKRSRGTSADPTAPPPSAAITSAQPIEDLRKVTYPDPNKPPQTELNLHAQPGKFRYDRDFLLQFMEIC